MATCEVGSEHGKIGRDGNLYILRRETSTPDGPWHLESFRQLTRQS
jgi:hypothetical protein